MFSVVASVVVDVVVEVTIDVSDAAPSAVATTTQLVGSSHKSVCVNHSHIPPPPALLHGFFFVKTEQSTVGAEDGLKVGLNERVWLLAEASGVGLGVPFDGVSCLAVGLPVVSCG